MATLLQDAPARNRFAPARAAWRTLLVHVQPEHSATPRLSAAVDLAAKLDATLVGLGAEMLQPIGYGDPMGMLGGQFLVALTEVIQTNLKTSAAAFNRRAAGVRGQWLELEDFPVNATCRLARGADLIVAGGSPLDAHDNYRWCDPAQLALQSGRPVLIAPPAGGELQAKAVIVAWKDTREARRALADSLPILKCADEVLVVAVCAKDDVHTANVHTASVLDFLLRHGVDARAKVVAGHPDEAAPVLQGEAMAIGADLIVAGAYGHSRLGEWIFGGVTYGLLNQPERFVLISH